MKYPGTLIGYLGKTSSVAPCDQSRAEKVSLGSLGEFWVIGNWTLFDDAGFILAALETGVGLELETLGLGKGSVLCCASCDGEAKGTKTHM